MSRIYVGEKPVKAVMIGGKKYVARDKSRHNVPAIYQRLEYIESTGVQYIDTGIKVSNDVGFVADFQFTKIASGQNFAQAYSGVANSWAYTALMMTSYSAVVDEMSFYGAFNSPGVKYKAADLNRHKFSFNKNNDCRAVFDERVFEVPSPLYSAESSKINFRLFCRALDSGLSNEYGSIKTYSCAMYKSGNLVRDFVPVKNRTTNIVGLWDMVSKTFFTDGNGGNFIGGDPV